MNVDSNREGVGFEWGQNVSLKGFKEGFEWGFIVDSNTEWEGVRRICMGVMIAIKEVKDFIS